MNLLDIVNTVLIGPLKLIFEVIFYISNTLLKSEGLSIVVLSFVLNILLLPLYGKAEEIQNKENDIQNKMKPYIDHIKKTFKSDEQYMVLSTYYRQNNYKPIYSLRSIVSLLLEIPFFIAAYSFLSNLSILDGSRFLVVNDLSKPDGLLIGINVIPILMTLINIVSCVIYTKGQPLKSKVQLYLMALVFLVLLYNAPSGLAFYYLLNNLFSLIKNILLKIRNRRKVIGISLITLSLCGLLFVIRMNSFSIKTRIVASASLMLVAIIGCLMIIGYKPKIMSKLKPNNKTFLFGSILMCILTGLLIPSQVIAASPVEFVDTVTFLNPLSYIFNAFLLSFGLFVIWMNVYYLLMDDKTKGIMSFVMWIFVICSLVNHLFFKNNLGIISYNLIYDFVPEFSFEQIVHNLTMLLLIMCVSAFIYLNKTNILNGIILIVCLGLSLMFGYNVFNINNEYKKTVAISKNIDDENNKPHIELSKTGKNVVILMLDRAISYYYPYLLEEKPILQEQFKGFTYYPNTISFGAHTNIATPALFGGYEYTPEELNKRDSEHLVDKHNEALKVLPVLFDENNFDVTVCDPPYANYSWIPDISIYDDYPNINKYLIENNKIRRNNEILNRNMFVYSIIRISPTFLFSTIYGHGNYMDAEISGRNNQLLRVEYEASYKELRSLIELTEFNDSKNSFVMLTNSTTHGPIEFQLPDYEYADRVNNTNYEKLNKFKTSVDGEITELNTSTKLIHYHTNMYAMLQLGRWFDYLRENNVYDNTRIILVSDHGRDMNFDPNYKIDTNDLYFYRALLLVKDFNSNELVTDYSMMTNADTPYLATNSIIENPKNPFTGNEIKEVEKENVEFKVFASNIWSTDINSGYTFIEDDWYSVRDNCLDINNWKKLGN